MGTIVRKNAPWKFDQAVLQNSVGKIDIEQARKEFRNTHILKENDKYTEYCLCGQSLKNAYILRNIHTNRLITIGETCLKKFGITPEKSLIHKINNKQYECNPDKKQKDMTTLTETEWEEMSILNLIYIKEHFTEKFKNFEERCDAVGDVEKYEKSIKVWILDYPEEFAEFAERIRHMKEVLGERQRLAMVILHEYQLQNEARLENERVERVKKEELIKSQEVERLKRIRKERAEKLFHITVDETFNDKYKEYTADGINTAIAYCALMDIDEMLQIKDHLELPDCMLSIVIAGDFPLLMFKSQTSNETYYMLNLITLKPTKSSQCQDEIPFELYRKYKSKVIQK